MPLYATMRSADIVFSLSLVFLWNLSPEHFIKICCTSDLSRWSPEFFGPWSESRSSITEENRTASWSRFHWHPQRDLLLLCIWSQLYFLFNGAPPPRQRVSLWFSKDLKQRCSRWLALFLSLSVHHIKRQILHQGPSRCRASQEGPPANQGPRSHLLTAALFSASLNGMQYIQACQSRSLLVNNQREGKNCVTAGMNHRAGRGSGYWCCVPQPL